MSDVQVCHICRLLWCVLVFGFCSYVVFFKDAAGLWFLLAILLCEGNCKSYRTAVGKSAE